MLSLMQSGWLTISRLAAIQFMLSLYLVAESPLGAAEFIPLGFLAESPPGAVRKSNVRQISDDGMVISGISTVAQGTNDVFRWTRNGGMSALAPGDGTPDPQPTMAADGSTLVWGLLFTNPNGQGRIWTEENGVQQFSGKLTNPISGTSFSGIGISDDGSVVSGNGGPVNGPVMRWTPGTGLNPLTSPAGYTSAGTVDLSGDGKVIAAAFGGLPFRWTGPGGWENLGAAVGGHTIGDVSADGSTIIGFSQSGLWRWTSSAGISLLDPNTATQNHLDIVSGLARSISADGSAISGTRGKPDGSSSEAFRWSEQFGLESLPNLPGHVLSIATDMSPDGRWIVGLSFPSAGSLANAAVWLWSKETGLHNLRDVMTSQGLGPAIAGWKIGEGNQTGSGIVYPTISANGRAIAMTGINAQGFIEGWVVYLDPLVVPEPANAGTGLSALLCLSLSHMWCRRARVTRFNGRFR
jgi:hypothetical protein